MSNNCDSDSLPIHMKRREYERMFILGTYA